jgi:UDP-N-acetylglucosamine 2-epimerase
MSGYPDVVPMTVSVVVGADPRRVLKAIGRYAKNPEDEFRACPYGKGDASVRICDALSDSLRGEP